MIDEMPPLQHYLSTTGWRRAASDRIILRVTVCFMCLVAAAPIQPPGETTANMEIAIGDNANVTCRIFEGGNSSSIWWSEENTKRRILQPSSEISIIDTQSAVLMIRNATEQIGHYQCMSGNNAIGITVLYVGTAPLEVSNFSCKGYDYDYITCSFIKPKNMIFTNYELHYQTDSDNHNYSYNCKLQFTDVRYICNITYHSSPVYLPRRQFYYFSLTSANALGSHRQQFVINNYKSVIPAKLNIQFKNITSESVTLHWKILKFALYEDQGLEYEIQLRIKGFDWYSAKGYDYCDSSNCSLTIENLKYPHREYTTTVRARVRGAKGDGSMWSEAFVGSFVTQARRPDAPPMTAVGAFYIDSTETHVRLYWRKLREYEENGSGFHYSIDQTDAATGVVIRSKDTNETSITFAWDGAKSYYYRIKSCNSIGESLDSSYILVRPQRRPEFLSQNIATVYHNRTYTLSWKPPINHSQLVNYTVFWCLSKMEMPNRCRGSITFMYLDRNATNFTTEPQDYTLNLAVSANYRDAYTGMQWASCSADVSSDLMKLEPEAIAESATVIKVQWSAERVCPSILKGFNLSYCEVPPQRPPVTTTAISQLDDCLAPKSTVALLSGHVNDREYRIEQLKSFTRYRIEMFMHSETKIGPNSDAIHVVTQEAAPTAPRHLDINYTSITSNSAMINWLPPNRINGKLKYYTIWKIRNRTEEHIDYERVYVSDDGMDASGQKPMGFKLESLNSYSNYEIYVTAHTVDSSAPSNAINFKTLVGRPTNPRDLLIANDGNNGILSWLPPEMPSGRVEFYVVALVIMHKKKATAMEDVREQYALVTGRKCKFRFPECTDSSYSYYLKVSAVNVAEKHEIDYSTFPNTKSSQRRRRRRRRRFSRHIGPEIDTAARAGLQLYHIDEGQHGNTTDSTMEHSSDQVNSGDAVTSVYKVPIENGNERNINNGGDDDGGGGGSGGGDNSFQCLDAIEANDEKLNLYRRFFGDDHHLGAADASHGEDIKFLSSSWENSTNIYQCSDFPIVNLASFVVMVLLVFVLLALVSYLLFKKYNKMKNINAVLPEELVGHMSTYQLNCNSVEKEHSDVSRSNDCLVYQKESHHLLSSICNGQSHVAKCLTYGNSHGPGAGDHSKPATSVSTCSDEVSSQCSASVEMNDISTSCISSTLTEKSNVDVMCLPATTDDSLPEKVGGGGTNGYIIPNTAMFKVAPAVVVAASDYVQPHMLLSQIANAVPKVIVENDVEIINNGDSTAGSTENAEPPMSARINNGNNANNNNNNNDSLICGYVTQRQLADFGQLLY